MKQEQLDSLRHSCAHLLAASALELWPNAQNAIGPSIENGFYQDFDFGDAKITEEDLPKIEDKMREMLQTWDSFNISEVTVSQAKKDFAWNKYKNELIDEFATQGKIITETRQGDFLDLCKGGHIKNPKKELGHFKLLSIAGAYWRGNEKNKMLTRVYGTCFATKDELMKYLKMLEEAKKRDHRKLGKELDLFVFSDLVGSGLPLFTPRGAILRNELIKYSEELRLKEGYERVWVPHITKTELYKTSGHWDKFGDELFLVKSQETNDELVIKPMNCPHHQQIYASRLRSYRDLPIKYLETTTIYRDEKAGELLGLSRVRSITQDDSHTFCRPDQIESVYRVLIKIVKEFYGTIGMELKARLSYHDPKQPEKYLGEMRLWNEAESIILKIAKENQLDYYEAVGEAAFYGPKIDFMATDALGREWQVATPQLDFVQPKRFGLKYTDVDGTQKTPVMIHFALLGSIERFLSVYIEHTAGIFPLWLAPTQVLFAPVGESHIAGAKELAKKFGADGIRAIVDDDNESINKKVRRAAGQKIPYIAVVGDRELAGDLWTIRVRGQEEQIKLSINDFKQKLLNEIKEKKSF